MKKHLINGGFILFGFCLIGFCLTACSERDIDPSDLPVIDTEYTLPQGKSDADDYIVEFYEKYGTYILYEFEEADLKWVQSDVNNLWNNFKYTSADPQYVALMVDFLQENVFRFYPDAFLSKELPYKIFLLATLKHNEYSNYEDVRIVGTQMAISNCAESLETIVNDPAKSMKLKNRLQSILWSNWLYLFDIPAEFYKTSTYSSGQASTDPSAWNYTRTMGFIADNEGKEWSTVDPWPDTKLSKIQDLHSYLDGMRNRTSEEWENDLSYPLVKHKYDVLRNYFKTHFGFDIQAIGDANDRRQTTN